MAVSVQFEIGHTAKLRAKKTPEGFTHDWDLYVRGSNKSDISAYVDRVIFNLHESFQRPKRVFKEPPYVIHESGYASFMLNIDIYFRNRDEPKRVQYTYDLDLQQHGPPHHRSEEKKFLFENPSEEFRQKLLKGGGVPVVPSGLTGSRSSSANPNIMPGNFNDSNSTSSANKHKSNNSNAELSGGNSNSNKKHKSRMDDSKLNTFANLFGTPDTGGKSNTTIPSKTNNDALKFGGKVSSPSTASVSSTNSVVKEKSSKEGKEKSSEKSKDKSERKEKHKSSSSNLSPTKESKKLPTDTGGKSEKRSEDKPKKDKSRDKERERNRNEQSSASTPNSMSGKSSSSSKTTPTQHQQPSVGGTPNAATQRISNQLSALPTTTTTPTTNRSDEKLGNAKPEKIEKFEKETKEKHSSSSSSGKKSKKEKKDKDKDKEKERDKEKRNSGDTKSKETHLSALQTTSSNSPIAPGTPNTAQQIANAQQQSKSLVTSSKKNDKELKQESFKSKPAAHSNDKSLEKQQVIPASTNATATGIPSDKKANSNASNNSSSSSTATKTHKHKKKDKNKEKDKDKDKDKDKEKEKERSIVSGIEKDKEKSKDKHKEKLEEKRETEKPLEVTATTTTTKSISPEFKKTTASLLPPTNNNNLNNSANESTTVPSKKSQNKEKKSKDSKSSKESKKRASDLLNIATSEPKMKTSKTSTPLSTAGSNIELSDADSRQSTSHDHSLKAPSSTTPTTTTSTAISTDAPDVHSDSSYCSFPEVPHPAAVKSIEKPVPPPTNASPEKSNNNRNSTAGSKENKQKDKDKEKEKEKEGKSSTKQLTDKSSSSSNKADKEDKKRRRSTVNSTPENTTTTTTFVEPPLKQTKREQSKTPTTVATTTTTARDSTKSPLPRNNTNVTANIVPNNNNPKTKNQSDATNSHDVDATTPNILTASPNPSVNSHTPNQTSNHTLNNVVNNSTPRTTPHPAASPALNNDTIWPNLSELQELHRKIMTLQDNDELQQVVELIAASGCYELTQRTFDFDLCKLDRGTVERLQEFFATSVS